MKHFFITSAILLAAFFAQAQQVFVGSKANDVMNELSLFIQDKFSLAVVDEQSGMKDSIFTVSFRQKVYTGTKQHITLKYTLSEAGEIKRLEIKGTLKELVSLYISYWKTKADYNTDRSIIAEKHFISDVIRLQRLQRLPESLGVITVSKAVS